MSKPITVKAAKSALNNLHKLKPANEKFDDDLEMSIKETVAFMAPDLIQLTKRGFTSKELSAGLAANGIHIKPGTLNRYLNEYLVAKQNVEKINASSVNGNSSNEKAEGESKPIAPALCSDVFKGTGPQVSSTQPAQNEVPKLESKAAGTFNGKDRTNFSNPKTSSENPTPGGQSADLKSDWTRVAETSDAPNRPRDYQSK